MFILENVPLQGYSTMRLGGPASYLVEVTTRSEIKDALSWASQAPDLPIMMIGSGSNIVWGDNGFPGLVIVNKIKGIERNNFDDETAYFKVAGGELWDEVVEAIVDQGFGEIAKLSLIPGTAGAAPVQNIGAYGAQLSDFLVTLEVYDVDEKVFKIMHAADCDFGYRTSRFKTTDKNKFFITAITLMLRKNQPGTRMYHSLEDYMQKNNISERSPQAIRNAVVSIRQNKLPDPAFVANCGSFFQNPVISRDHLVRIKEAHPRLANWHSVFTWELPNNMFKIAAGALLEHEGFKDYHDEETGMATWKDQALVVVNEHANNTEALLKFKHKIIDKIKNEFDITLEQEPELI